MNGCSRALRPNREGFRSRAPGTTRPLLPLACRRSLCTACAAPFGTLAEWVECPVGVVAQIQGHKPSATAEKRYRRRPLDLLRMWHVKIEGWILEQAGIEQPGDELSAGLRVVKT